MLKQHLILIRLLSLSICLIGCHNAVQLEVDKIQHTIPYLQHKTAPIQGGSIEYYELGQGKPLLLVAGYLTDVSSWDHQFISELARNHRVILYNHRLVGRSYIKDKALSNSKTYAEDIAKLLKVLHIKKTNLLGISMGGMISQHFAILHPELLNKLILINTAAPGNNSIKPSPTTQKAILTMPENKVLRLIAALKLFFPKEQYIPMMHRLINHRFLTNDLKEIDFEFNRPLQQSVIYCWRNNNSVFKKLKNSEIATLILSGDKDIVIPPANSQKLHKAIKNSQLIKVKDGGHGMIFQYPHLLAQKINTFLLTH